MVDFKLAIDLNGSGLNAVLKDYQQIAMECVWDNSSIQHGLSSREVYVAVNTELEDQDENRKSISRASIINFLNSMVDEGILSYTETTGKGGHRRIYHAELDREAFMQHITGKALRALDSIKQDLSEVKR